MSVKDSVVDTVSCDLGSFSIYWWSEKFVFAVIILKKMIAVTFVMKQGGSQSEKLQKH